MPTLVPYLNFDGKTEEAFNFYRSVFGGDFMGEGFMRFGGMPEGDQIPEEVKNRVMHVTLPVGDTFLMGSDTMPGYGKEFVQGNNSQIMINPETREEADRLFAELSDGGNVEMGMQDTFWGAYFGSFTDKFGVCWMIHHQTGKE